jgi:hypothetical protein
MLKVRGRFSLLCLALVIAFSSTGCVLVPFVRAFKETGLTEGDRMELLAPQLKKFSEARLFGNKSQAMELVAPEAQSEISKQLQDINEQERIVKSQVDEIEWIDGARKARVVMKIDSFKVSHLVVSSKREEQHWEFSPGVGWLMTSREQKVEG